MTQEYIHLDERKAYRLWKEKRKKKKRKRKNKQIKYYRVKYSKDVFANGKAYVSKWYRKLLEE